MLRQLRPALVAVVVFTVLTGLLYPVVVTAIAQVAFDDDANGSLVVVDGTVRGSELIAQPFAGDEWFQPRPSAVGYAADNSGGSNQGPTDPELLTTIAERAAAYRERNGLPAQASVPIDAVTASGSGLDPHISPRNARLQSERVAAAAGNCRSRRSSSWSSSTRRVARPRFSVSHGSTSSPSTSRSNSCKAGADAARTTPDPSRRGAGRRQDVRDAQRRQPARRTRHRCRGRLGRDSRSSEHSVTDR